MAKRNATRLNPSPKPNSDSTVDASDSSTTPESSQINPPPSKPQQEPTPDPINEAWSNILKSFEANAPNELIRDRPLFVRTILKAQVKDQALFEQYNVVLLYDQGALVKDDADKIYNAVTSFKHRKPILLILYSNGGKIEPAYLVSKLCREHSDQKFVIAVPRQAKSAATLICCGADEIHMGGLSELGPIDPQIDGLPTLGLKNSIEHVAELVNKYPGSSEMFAKYLQTSLQLIHLGYYERIAESAKQYAERLLSQHGKDLPTPPAEIARSLVYGYMDHSFVIDRGEAKQIFGSNVVKTDSREYQFANEIYEQLSFFTYIFDQRGFDFWWIGSIDSNCSLYKRKSTSNPTSQVLKEK